MAEKSRERGLHEADVDIVDVVADGQYGTLQPTQILAAFDARPTQEKDRGAHQHVVRKAAKPANGPTKRPARVVIFDPTRSVSHQHLLKIADGSHGAVAGFTEIGLVAIFERAEQFDALQ